MSASSRPTRKPRSRRPNARLSAVVDLPTPPLPEATAMTAAMPGISACLDIGEAGLCGGRCEATGGTPWIAGRGGGAEPGLRSAVNAIIAAATPGMARTAASACARTLSQARASAASTLIEKKTLPSVTVTGDKHVGIGQGDAARRRHPGQCIENLLLRDAQSASPQIFRMRPIERCDAKGYLAPTSSARSRGADPACSLAAS